MDIKIYVCDSALALIETLGELEGQAEILYRTHGEAGETGDLKKCRVRPPMDPATTIESFTNKFIVVARRPH